MEKLNELMALRSQIKALEDEAKPQALARMSEIQANIKAQIAEGVTLADAYGLAFDLSDVTDLPYGSGDLCYYPVGYVDEYGDSSYSAGWKSSATSC